MNADLFDRTAFRAWLEQQPPDVTVGNARWCTQCPLSSYARVELGNRRLVKAVYVLEDEYVADETAYPLPAWAQAFVLGVDEAAPGTAITAGQALAILDGVTE